MNRTPMKLAAAVAFIVCLASCWGDNAKRLDALTRQANKRSVCVAENIEKPREVIIDTCFKNVTGDDLKDAYDLIAGIKAGVVKAGVASPGMVYGSEADAGSK